MANLTRSTQLRPIGPLPGPQVPIKASSKIYMGAMVALLTASGLAVRAGTAGTGRVAGVAKAEAAIPASDGAVSVNLACGLFAFPLHATHTPTQADVGKDVFASDDNTLSNLASDGPVAGTLQGFTADGLGIVEIRPPVGGTGVGSIEIPLYGILAAGTPMAAFADNASSNPGITLADSKAMGLRWNNAASQTAVFLRGLLPGDIDTSKDATVEVIASKTGATVGDATTFTIAAYNAAVGALYDADTNFGGATSAMTGDAAAKTVQKVTRTLTAADLGVAGEPFTLSIKPTDGTLGTDDVIVHGVRIVYRRKS